MYDVDTQYGSGSQSSRAPSNPTYVQHSDAGLLLDDSLENEERLAIEVPPDYQSVSAGRRAAVERRERQAHAAAAAAAASAATPTIATAATTANPTSSRTGEEANSSQELGQGSENEPLDSDDNFDSKMWRSVP